MTRLSVTAYGGYALLGVISMLLPILLPDLLHTFVRTPAEAALLFPIKAGGALVGSLAAGVLSDRHGRRPILLGSGVLAAAALLLLAVGGTWLAVATGFLALGVALAVLATGINALTADLHPAGEGVRAFNWLHGIYSLGAAGAPLVLGAALLLGGDWRPPLVALAGLLACFTLLAAATAYPVQPASGDAQRGAGSTVVALLMLRERAFLLLFAVAFIYNGLAWSLLGWLNYYLEDVLALPPLSGAAALASFYVALAGGRFATPAVTRWLGQRHIMLALTLGTALAYPLVLVTDHRALILAGCFLAGLCLGGLYPLALAWANQCFPGKGGAVAGTLAVAMILGSMAPPWWTGVLGTLWTFRGALAVNGLLLVPLVVIAWVFLRQGPPGRTSAPRLAAPRLSRTHRDRSP